MLVSLDNKKSARNTLMHPSLLSTLVKKINSKMNLPNTNSAFFYLPPFCLYPKFEPWLYESAVKARFVGFQCCKRVKWWMVSAQCKVSHGDAVERSLCHVCWPSHWISDDAVVKL